MAHLWRCFSPSRASRTLGTFLGVTQLLMSSSVTEPAGPGLLEAGCCDGTFGMTGLIGCRTSCSLLRVSVSIVCKSTDSSMHPPTDAEVSLSYGKREKKEIQFIFQLKGLIRACEQNYFAICTNSHLHYR